LDIHFGKMRMRMRMSKHFRSVISRHDFYCSASHVSSTEEWGSLFFLEQREREAHEVKVERGCLR